MKNIIFEIPSTNQRDQKLQRLGKISNKNQKQKHKRKLSKETEITKDTQTSTCKECNLKDIYNQEQQFKNALKEAIDLNEDYLTKIVRLEAMLSAAQDEIEQRDECILELYNKVLEIKKSQEQAQ